MVLVFQPNWSLQAINLEIFFLGQEFVWIFVCKCCESFLELISPTLEKKGVLFWLFYSIFV